MMASSVTNRQMYYYRFSPEVVWDLDEDQIEYLGSEDDSTIQNRNEYEEKLHVLQEGLKELDAFTARPDSSMRLSAAVVHW